VLKAIEEMKSGKAARIYDIQRYICKNGGAALNIKLHELFTWCWKQDFREAVIQKTK